MPWLHSDHHFETSVDDKVLISSALNRTTQLQRQDTGSIAGNKSGQGIILTSACDNQGNIISTSAYLSNQPQGPNTFGTL